MRLKLLGLVSVVVSFAPVEGKRLQEGTRGNKEPQAGHIRAFPEGGTYLVKRSSSSSSSPLFNSRPPNLTWHWSKTLLYQPYILFVPLKSHHPQYQARMKWDASRGKASKKQLKKPLPSHKMKEVWEQRTNFLPPRSVLPTLKELSAAVMAESIDRAPKVRGFLQGFSMPCSVLFRFNGIGQDGIIESENSYKGGYSADLRLVPILTGSISSERLLDVGIARELCFS